MSDNITKRVGLGTAYGFAKAGGYEGTVAEFTELLGNIAIDLARIENLSVTVTTLPAGSQATASLNGSVLSLGIPKGDTGATGATGETGAPAGFGTVSATVDDNIGTPSVEVTASGADTAKNFAFAFHNLKGQKGDKGDTGDVTLSQLEDFTVVQTDENAEPYNFRATPKCGHIERLKKVVGASVAFNQLVQNGNFASIGVWQPYECTYDVSGNVAEVTATSAYAFMYQPVPCTNSHKFVVACDIQSNDITSCYFYWDGTPLRDMAVSASWSTVSMIYSGTGRGTNISVRPNGITSGKKYKLRNFFATDLTLALGSTIADYVYGLETATAGSGVAWLKQHFPKMFSQYNAYDAGSIRSVEGVSEHKVVGFNQWDEEWEVGSLNPTSGEPTASATQIRSKNFIPVIGGATYYGHCASLVGTTTGNLVCNYYDANKNFVSYGGGLNGTTNAIPNDVHYIKIWAGSAYGTTYNHDICINISDTSKNGTYEPYTVNSYPLDSDLTLRGMLKISNGNLYADGDEYYPSGGVNREWAEIDLGSLDWTDQSSDAQKSYYSPVINNIKKPASDAILSGSVCARYTEVVANGFVQSGGNKVFCISQSGRINANDNDYASAQAFETAMSGVKLVYPLATPTTETADPFTENQICESGGTEEFVSTSIVPIGHETEYPLTLSDIRPTANGNYVLKCTVSNGKASYEWVSA